MKIRIKGNSLRYRLTKTDIEHLKDYGYVEETIQFGPRALKYALSCTVAGDLHAEYNNDTITTHIPKAMANELTDTDRVGFENSSSLFYLLIEKDFKCLDNVAEDQSDNYPNPLAFK